MQYRIVITMGEWTTMNRKLKTDNYLDMFHDILFLLMGLVLIVIGGNYVTDGSVAIANRFKVPPLVVGITVVAFGSSTPDLVVSVMSTIQGKSELAIGDVVGAGMFDMLLVIGITALISPITIKKSARVCDLPSVAVAAVLLFLCTQDRWFSGGHVNQLSRFDGIILLIVFAAFMVYTFTSARKDESQVAKNAASPSAATVPSQPVSRSTHHISISDLINSYMWIACFAIAGGLAVLVVGGNWIVDGASGIAEKAGLSEGLVGLTVVAIGSSIPDLATSVVAAVKHQPGIAMGNVFGSCIMDMLFVLGTCSIISPLHTGNITFVSFASLAAVSIMMALVGFFYKPHKITRAFGVVLILLYVAYMTYLVLAQQ